MTTIALLSLGGRRERWIPYVIFAASMIRLDLLLLAPALVAARFADASLRPTSRSARDTRHFALPIVLALAATVAWYAVFGARYLIDAGDYLIIGTYFRFVARRLEERPEDNPEAEVSDGAGDLGFFSPGS